jgi:cytochrome c oxidase cbb3-type subunit 3
MSACDDAKRTATEAQTASAAAAYEETPSARAAGERTFHSMQCGRCHTPEGSMLAPSLRDTTWRFGSDPSSVFETIMNGRPGGMAPYRGRLSDREVWQLVAFVRSLGGVQRNEGNSR